MQAIFVGGAQGVGASCLALELAGGWVVVDAGVRVDRKADPLPDLAILEGKDIRAIFVTHAHADHIGALPLLHEAFPAAPIYASRATALLMEVMLADALKIMARRAVEEMELPLYRESLVASMLSHVRPLPVGTAVTLPDLPGVSIHASRAGHIAGAVNLGFVSTEGTIVVSGDMSSTPQRTVPGATPPPVTHCDLLVLESTYGARLHPNRQAEEHRLAQAVAEGLARGGHVLIPCFGLGRGQEILLLLQAAQEQGHIPDFPIYVDGLVRRVCATYMLVPEVLSPQLQRQIRKGYMPFEGQAVTFIQNAEERERILAGPPACILSSSGMLTGGPSAWYAARLAANPRASILITGYQDEESPGKRLLDLAEQRQGTLEISGKTIQVLCMVAKYSLSAHADGAELAAFAAALRPSRVALVHGDDEARAALRQRLEEVREVILPRDGEALDLSRAARASSSLSAPAAHLEVLPRGIGQGVWFDASHIEQLWKAVSACSSYSIVTLRELVDVWYGDDVLPEHPARMLGTLEDDDPYFIRLATLEEAFRIRRHQQTREEAVRELAGQLILIRPWPNAAKAVLCRAIEPRDMIRVQYPRGSANAGERTRFPLRTVLEVIGPLYAHAGKGTLTEIVQAARTKRGAISVRSLAAACQEGQEYTLSHLCQLAQVRNSLSERLAVAKVVLGNPQLFAQKNTFMEGNGQVRYGLIPGWRELIPQVVERQRPDQTWIRTVLRRHLGSPPELLRIGIDPATGQPTLTFAFPAVAAAAFAEQIDAAAAEIGLPVIVAPHANQAALTRAALAHTPAGLKVLATPSLHVDRCLVVLKCSGQASAESFAGAQERFRELTGWQLEITGSIEAPGGHREETPISHIHLPVEPSPYPPASARPLQWADGGPMEQQEALQAARDLLGHLPGFRKVGIDAATSALVLRFDFPLAAERQHGELFALLQAQTGRPVHLHPTTRQDILAEKARSLLPAGLHATESPSIYHDDRSVAITCTGTSDRQAAAEAARLFAEETGWQLEIQWPGRQADSEAADRLPQGEAMARVSAVFSQATDLYHIGLDTKRWVLWLHFHFPDIARKRYALQLAQAAEETGWRVELHPRPHQNALQQAARRLLPDHITIVGKASLFHERCELSLTCQGSISPEARAEVARQFTEVTGWRLELQGLSDELPGPPTEESGRMEEAEVVAELGRLLKGSFKRISVDTMRGVLLVDVRKPDFVQEHYATSIADLQERSRWHIELNAAIQ